MRRLASYCFLIYVSLSSVVFGRSDVQLDIISNCEAMSKAMQKLASKNFNMCRSAVTPSEVRFLSFSEKTCFIKSAMLPSLFRNFSCAISFDDQVDIDREINCFRPVSLTEIKKYQAQYLNHALEMSNYKRNAKKCEFSNGDVGVLTASGYSDLMKSVSSFRFGFRSSVGKQIPSTSFIDHSYSTADPVVNWGKLLKPNKNGLETITMLVQREGVVETFRKREKRIKERIKQEELNERNLGSLIKTDSIGIHVRQLILSEQKQYLSTPMGKQLLLRRSVAIMIKPNIKQMAICQEKKSCFCNVYDTEFADDVDDWEQCVVENFYENLRAKIALNFENFRKKNNFPKVDGELRRLLKTNEGFFQKIMDTANNSRRFDSRVREGKWSLTSKTFLNASEVFFSTICQNRGAVLGLVLFPDSFLKGQPNGNHNDPEKGLGIVSTVQGNCTQLELMKELRSFENRVIKILKKGN